MKRLITICAVVGLMLSATCVSWAVPEVTPPTGAPSWWNVECEYYAYGWWEDDIIVPPGATNVSPPLDVTHWASNFLANTDFTASVGTTITINLDNDPCENFYKEIFIYLNGTTTSTPLPILTVLDTDGGTFDGETTYSILSGQWWCRVVGEIDPQPDWVNLTVTVPGLTSVTNIWAGENCVPEPATIGLLGLGALSLIRRKRGA